MRLGERVDVPLVVASVVRNGSTEQAAHGYKPGRLGALPPRYSFVLNPYPRARFTRCPTCDARTRLRKLPLVVHVEHSAGPRLVIVGKTCRLCVTCDLLIAHRAELARLIASSAVADETKPPSYAVLGTADRRVWRRGLVRTITLGEVRDCMADFKGHMRVDFTPGGWNYTGRP